MTKKSEIPFGAQFSPNQVRLPVLLQIIHKHAGDREAIVEAILSAFFSTHAQDADKPATQRTKLAGNTVLALQTYGLLERDSAKPTPLANHLMGLHSDPSGLYECFARHILVDLKGITFVDTIDAMQSAGIKITLTTLRKHLEQRGVYVPRGSVHLSSLRLWLAKAGIFDPAARRPPRLYRINKDRLREVLGVGLDVIDKLAASLTPEQRAYLRALTRIPEQGPFSANDVADLATTLYDTSYNHKALPKTILFPLQEMGYIEVQKTTAGRGAKPYAVSPTLRFREEIAGPIIKAASDIAGIAPKQLFELSLAQILAGVRSADTNTKGKSLEMLAIYFMRLLDLRFVAWRHRSHETGGAEVDVILEGARLIFSRWQIQAKNTATVRLDHIAKEVGLSVGSLHSNVVMVLTTGNFTADAYRFADQAMRSTNLNIVLVSGSELQRISEKPTMVGAILSEKAENALQIKRPQLGDIRLSGEFSL